MTVAILDWGIGGVPTWNEIRQRAPHLDLVYVSDSGFAPYGTIAADDLATRLIRITRSLCMEHGVTQVVVACNAASTVLERVDQATPCEMLGIIDDGIGLALASNAQLIGVLGGEGTIRSDVHGASLRAADRRVIARSAQILSAHVEAGRLGGAEVEADVRRVMAPLRSVDAILLACTHYGALLPIFRSIAPSIPFFDPCIPFSDRVLGAAGIDGNGTRLTLTTGAPAGTRDAARRAFGVDLGEVLKFAP